MLATAKVAAGVVASTRLNLLEGEQKSRPKYRTPEMVKTPQILMFGTRSYHSDKKFLKLVVSRARRNLARPTGQHSCLYLPGGHTDHVASATRGSLDYR